MTNSKRPYKTFTHEFKLEAVRLMSESNRPTAEKTRGVKSLYNGN
jgi:hypothetical protein